MNICVCIKQVPDTTEIKTDPVTNTLIRDGVPGIINPYDTYALENAARLRDISPGTKIVVITMGPGQAKNALRECLAIAADKAYLITDRAFGGSDTLATSYILAEAIKTVEETEGKFDCIFCGRQAIDGDTAQVGPEIAAHLNYPQITCAVECSTDAQGLKVIQKGADAKRILFTPLPCVVTFTMPGFSVRIPNIRRRMAANRAEIPELCAADLKGIDPARCGLKGSPTRVIKTFVPARTGSCMILRGEPEGVSKKLAELLAAAHII